MIISPQETQARQNQAELLHATASYLAGEISSEEFRMIKKRTSQSLRKKRWWDLDIFGWVNKNRR